MGKGDKKSRRGKIILGTYGVRRRKKVAGKVEKSTGNQPETKPLNGNVEASKPPSEVRKAKVPAKPKKEPSEVKETRQVKETPKPSEPKTPRAKKA